MSASPSVLIMAGGTGGHVFPALAVADCLRERGVHVEWLGTAQKIESRVVPEAGIPIHYISISGLRGKGVMSLLKAPLQLLRAIWQALTILRQLRPACVLGMGGFASGPGGVAAWLTGRPLVIHEQNAVAGTTNRLLSTLAKSVLQGYPIGLGGDKGQYIGNPIRQAIAAIPAPEQRWAGRSGRLNLLVLGGSLGAKPINDVLPPAIAAINAAQRPHIWHQSGELHVDAVKQMYADAEVDAKVEAFIADMAAAYSWADLVLCRAGALTVAELTAAGVGSVLIPLPHAIDDHQTKNAQWLAQQHGAVLLPQTELSQQRVTTLLTEFSSDRNRLLTMAKAAHALSKPTAAEQVAQICMEFANG